MTGEQRVECSLRRAGSRRWVAGVAQPYPGGIRFRSYPLMGMRIVRGAAQDIAIDTFGELSDARFPLAREAWDLNSHCVIVPISGGPYAEIASLPPLLDRIRRVVFSA